MTREEYIEFANALKNNYTIDFDKLPEFCDMAISALSENKGEWIYQQGIVPYKWRCNKCEKMFKTDFNYCPNCGADMRGE